MFERHLRLAIGTHDNIPSVLVLGIVVLLYARTLSQAVIEMSVNMDVLELYQSQFYSHFKGRHNLGALIFALQPELNAFDARVSHSDSPILKSFFDGAPLAATPARYLS